MELVTFEIDAHLADSFEAALPAPPPRLQSSDSDVFVFELPPDNDRPDCGGIGVGIYKNDKPLARYLVGYFHGPNCPFSLSVAAALQDRTNPPTLDACSTQEAGGRLWTIGFPGIVQSKDLQPSRLIQEVLVP